MKTKQPVAFLILLFVTIIGCKDTKDTNGYLKEVLANLEKIETASYYETAESWQHGDTVAMNIYCTYVKEYDNPADSTIGASYVNLDCDDPTKLKYGYDGNVGAHAFHKEKGIMLDDFASKAHLPFRPLTPPFFNYARNIIEYALTTGDSIVVTMEDLGNAYYVKLTIYEDAQVEFFGKAYHMPESPYIFDPVSNYELWIGKSDDLPYKIRREMSHDISVTSCADAEFNKLSIEDFHLDDYFPEDYEIRMRGQKSNELPKKDLTGEKAPVWTLDDMNEQPVSLADFKSNVLLVNLTGIGCGACTASIPFLKDLKGRFSTEDFELVAIETWVRKPHSLQNYTNKNELNYPVLGATDEVVKDYRTGGAAPYFFILDEQRVVRKVIRGYAKDKTDKEIIEAITALLQNKKI